METTSPPLTPLRQYMMSPPIDTSVSPVSSPTHSFRTHLRRRTSSFSSNHDRSPATPKSRHRVSNASQLFGEFNTPVDEANAGLGNLADELDQLNDDEFDEGETESALLEEANKDEASRDSGIDVSFKNSTQRQHNHVRNFSKPFSGSEEKPSGDEPDEGHDKFSLELEDLMSSINRMTSYTDASEDPLIPRAIDQLQNLGNQSSLEAAAQRFTTSTNSMSAHLTNQSKSLQTVSQSLYPIFAFSAPLDPVVIEEIIPLVEALQTDIPRPDTLPVQKLQKLDMETGDVIQALTHLIDTLQMGKQITTAAARHLRTTQNIVEDLRRERESAEEARHELDNSDWEARISNRWCGGECKDIISGFEERCNTLRGRLEKAIEAGA